VFKPLAQKLGVEVSQLENQVSRLVLYTVMTGWRAVSFTQIVARAEAEAKKRREITSVLDKLRAKLAYEKVHCGVIA
jgi:hypothetical protein